MKNINDATLQMLVDESVSTSPFDTFKSTIEIVALEHECSVVQVLDEITRYAFAKASK